MKSFWMFAALAVVLSVTGCGDDNKEIAVTSIELSESSLTLNPGDKVQVNATVLPVDAANKKYDWSSDNEAVAKVNAGGLIEAVAAGTTKVWAKTANGKVSAAVDVTVQDIDNGKAVEGVYSGNFQIQGDGGAVVFSVPMNLTLEYKSLGKVSFSAVVPNGIPGAVVDPSLPADFFIPVTLTCTDVTVAITDDGYSLAGSGSAIVPPAILQQLMGSTMSPPMTLAGTINEPGKLNLRFDIMGVGEVFFRAQ